MVQSGPGTSLREEAVGEQRVQRRLAAILAADVAGYSRLTGADEEGTIARLRALRGELIAPAIAEYRGRIVKTTGDGILIEFASVVDAVRCAVEVQRGMATRNTDVAADRRIEFRVGIHLGDVVVEGDDLLGDGVNVAARLEGMAEAGGISLSEDAFRQVKGKTPLDFEDRGEQALKNIAEPLRVYALRQSALGSASSANLRQRSTGIAPRSGQQSIPLVVFPFTALGSSDQNTFASAITETLVADLSRYFTMRLAVSRGAGVSNLGTRVDIKEARQLGARYALEGGLQFIGGRIRITARLLDATNGVPLWSDRFDKVENDLLDTQDEVVAHIGRNVQVQLIEAEVRRVAAEQRGELSSAEFYALGWAHWLRGMSRRNCARALEAFEQAARVDGGNIAALAVAGWLRVTNVLFGWSANRAEDLSVARSVIGRALGENPSLPLGLYAKGFLCVVEGKPSDGVEALDQVLAMSPGVGMAHANAAFPKLLMGRAGDAIISLNRALQLSPRDPYVDMILGWLGAAHLCLQQYDKGTGMAGEVIGPEHRARYKLFDARKRVRSVR
jgi:class 3 adenylate cyclase/TolB-like protein